MGKIKRVKCPICGTMNNRELAVVHNSKHYCEECVTIAQQQAKHYKALIGYICELYELKAPTGWILKQIKDYKENYNYSYLGMKTTLHFFYEIQGNIVDYGTGVGIIPFVYDKAKTYYKEKKAIKIHMAQNDNIDLAKTSTITIQATDQEGNSKYVNDSLIDINTIK